MDGKSIVMDPRPLDPRTCSIYTIRARMCPESRQRQQGTEWCEICPHPCEWGTEYIRRHRLTEFRKPAPRKEVETVYRHRIRIKEVRAPEGGGTSEIRYFGGWLGEYIRLNEVSMTAFARRVGYSFTIVRDAVQKNNWTRTFELRVLAELNLDERTVIREAEDWALRNGVYHSISPD